MLRRVMMASPLHAALRATRASSSSRALRGSKHHYKLLSFTKLRTSSMLLAWC